MPNLPLLLPVLGVGVLVGIVASGRLARWLECPRWVALVLVVGMALVAAVTLTPQRVDASGDPSWPFGWLVGWLGERVLNVLLFVPMGVAVAFVGRRRIRGVLIAGVLLLPWAVEGVQHLVGPLARDAQWQDVIDNTAGVVIGLVIGWVLRARLTPPPGGRGTRPGRRVGSEG